MERTTTILIAIMMASVSLAGCSGDDSGYEETISSMEQDSIADQATIAALNATISSLTTDLETLGVQITALDSQIAELQTDIDDLVNAKALLEAQALVLESEKALLEAQVSSLTTSNQDAATDIAELQALASELNQTILQLESTISEMQDSDTPIVSTLDTIMERGSMKCGIKESQYGMGYLDSATGVRSGLDITYCRAIAAAIGMDPDSDVEYVPAGGNNRFDLLADGTIDVLIRTTTWTTSRDADLDVDFGAINFYDGQGIMVNLDEFPNAESALDLDGASICVAIGSTSAGNIADYFEENDMDYQEVNSWNDGPDFANEVCDAVTGDLSSLVSMKWEMEQNGDADFEIAIMPEIISKEPLASVTRDYDSEWNEVVSWVWFGMVTAEESGVTSSNYATQANEACETTGSGSQADPRVCRLLTSNFGLGTADNPLSDTWMQDVLAASGNYGEAYDDAFCDGTYDGVSGSGAMSGCLISRAGTLNALVSEGGIQYAPSMR